MKRAAVLALFSAPGSDGAVGLVAPGITTLADLAACDPKGVQVLLLERAATLRSAPGQVAFPGGMNDPGEDAVTTALREATEETGLDAAGVRVLSVLPPREFRVGQMAVDPVVAWWRCPSAVWAVDPRETATVFQVPVAQLLDPARQYTAEYRSAVDAPVTHRGPAWLVPDAERNEQLIWGFSAGILADLITELGWGAGPGARARVLELGYRDGLVRPV